MTVPAAFLGPWVRRGLVVGEEPGAEPAEVLWLQGREWFVDVRVPVDGVVAGPATTDLGARAEAFGGRCMWAPIDGEDPDRIGTLAWCHEIDLASGFAGGDAGVVEWISPTSFEERGSFSFEGVDVPFRETWTSDAVAVGSFAAVASSVESGSACVLVVAVGHQRGMVIDERSSGGPSGFVMSVESDDETWNTIRSEVVGDVVSIDATIKFVDSLCSSANALRIGETIIEPTRCWTVVENEPALHDGVPLSKLHRNIPSVGSRP
jgi:hypothetical protein